MIPRIKSRLVSLIAGWLNWVSDRVIAPAPDRSLRLRFGWWVEGRLTWIFTIVYRGSEAEVLDGIEFAFDAVADEYLTPMQVKIKQQISFCKAMRRASL